MPLTVEDAELVVDRLLARKLSDDAGSVNNVFTTGFGRTTFVYDTLRENGAINSQLDAIHTVLVDEDAQTDRIEAAIANLGLPSQTHLDVVNAVKQALREGSGGTI